MVFNSDIDEAMADIKKSMLLLRRNSDADSALFWEALLEVNRALATEDTEKAIRYLKELLKVFELSSKYEFPDVYTHITNAYEYVSQSGRNLEDVNSVIKTIKRYSAVSHLKTVKSPAIWRIEPYNSNEKASNVKSGTPRPELRLVSAYDLKAEYADRNS